MRQRITAVLKYLLILKYCQSTMLQAHKSMNKTICRVENNDAITNEKSNPPTTHPIESSTYALFTPRQSSSLPDVSIFAPIVNSIPHKKHPILRIENENPRSFIIDKNSPVEAWRKPRENFTAMICKSVTNGVRAMRIKKQYEIFIFLLTTLLPAAHPIPIQTSQPAKIIPILSSLP